MVVLGGMADVRLEFFLLEGSPKSRRSFYYAQLKHKVSLLPSGVQGLVPTEASLSSFTMNRSPIESYACSCFSVDRRTLGLGPAEDWNEWNKKQHIHSYRKGTVYQLANLVEN
ncbi:hypothetical protein AVEN_176072-1 [Araneus ventricosus]|uniref:Uncharacterized protein n=1 Tax=Araneus ventricosus TaxID=182803 RepID=A0A4Y2F7N1_ARAVE|nr:hypothetical protein AVEN_176072-1 [Araneus ventricosus]